MIWFDTEGVGTTGPLVTIQYSGGKGCDIILHRVWDVPVKDTLLLIESFADSEVVGFNLVHDWFVLSKWYNVFRQVSDKSRKPMEILREIQAIEARGPRPDDLCLKPVKACDLMLLARSGKFQYLARHKPIVVRKVPVPMQYAVIDALSEGIQLPPGVTLNWKASEKKAQKRKDVIDIVGKFEGLSTSLKHLYAVVSGEPQTGTFAEEVGFVPYKDVPDWRPWGGDWAYATVLLTERFRTDERSIDYAYRDVHYTYRLWEALGSPPGGDDDSTLACAIGAAHWRGFAIESPDRIEALIRKKKQDADQVPFCMSPDAVREYLGSFLNPTEMLVLTDTKKATLEELSRWDEHAVQAPAKAVRAARQARSRMGTLKKLYRAGIFTFSMKVLGALSSRMSGGSEEGEGGMNAQGIPREKEMRSLFPLAFTEFGEHLEGGDFDAFEVGIADAVYHDVNLAADIRSGKKFHAITGSLFYGQPYETILATKGQDPLIDRYSRAKNGFFCYVYGGQDHKLAQVLDLPESEAAAGRKRLIERYAGIGEHRARLQLKYSPIWQEKGIGSRIHWRDPQEYVESILGFRRYFSLEWSVVRGLFNLQDNPPASWLAIRGECRRTDRAQTMAGAARSALFGAMFSVQSGAFRAAANHEIQSPGGQITKHMQRRIWDHQPSGVGHWLVRPLNVHDEVLCPTKKDDGILNATVQQVVREFQSVVPMLKMEWGPMNKWSDK